MVKKIIVKLQGGLGNQLFQCAFAMRLRNETHAKLVLDTSDFQYDSVGREYALKPFDIEEDVIIDSSGKFNWKYDQRKNWLIKIGVKLCPDELFRCAAKYGIYIWEDISYKDFSIDEKKNCIMLHGLWQSEKYFSSEREFIKKKLKVAFEPNERDNALINEMYRTNSVCVHIRRGDFLKKSNSLCVCPESYFLKAVEYIKSRIESPVFYVFSDDIDEVKQNFDFGIDNMIYVQGYRHDYEEFRLMYSCKHFIISNSTFSWWASYLRNGDGIVIAPRKWYEDSTDISNLIRKDMLCM